MRTRMVGNGFLALILTTSATAAMANYSYFEQHAYGPQLQRCVDLLRPAVVNDVTDRVSFEIEEIELRGPWFRFEIRATVHDQDGATRLDGYKVGCKANRWVAKTRLFERPNRQPAPEQLQLLGRN